MGEDGWAVVVEGVPWGWGTQQVQAGAFIAPQLSRDLKAGGNDSSWSDR